MSTHVAASGSNRRLFQNTVRQSRRIATRSLQPTFLARKRSSINDILPVSIGDYYISSRSRHLSTTSAVAAWSLRSLANAFANNTYSIFRKRKNAPSQLGSSKEQTNLNKSVVERSLAKSPRVRKTSPVARTRSLPSRTSSGSKRTPSQSTIPSPQAESIAAPKLLYSERRAVRIARHRTPLAPQRKPRAKAVTVPIIPKAEASSSGDGATTKDSQKATKESKLLQSNVIGQSRVWTPQSRRTGLIGIKRGMSAVWDEMGIRVPVTVIQIEDNQVLSNILTPRGGNKPPYRAVQIGAKNIPRDKTHIGMRGHFKRADVPCKKFVKEFEVSEDAHLPLGMKLSAFHFVPGQYVDVQATTMGKGFQGVMRRWNFSGGTASHGNSLAHRTPGTTGQHQDPGRVWPGKKMPGRMGGKVRTMQNLYVVRVDTHLNLIFVKGNVPGPDDGRTPVYITDAKKKLQSEALRIQKRTGGEGDWVAVDATGKVIVDNKKAGKEEPKEMGRVGLGLGNGVTSLPFPAASVGMAKRYAPIHVAPSVRVTSPWVGGDGA
ncbi:translation protein [Serendipita vermifera]|nr:translation protein [Serendipita vermifera]